MKRIIIIGVILLIAGGLAWFYMMRLYQPIPPFTRALREADTFHHRALGSDQAIEKYREALTLAPDSRAKSRTVAKLGYELFNRNRDKDRIEAVRLFKEVLKDQTPVGKASMMNELAFNLWGLSTVDRDQLTDEVFGEDPFKVYLAAAEGDAYVATRKIFEASDQIYPTGMAKIMIALMYAERMLGERLESGLSSEEAAGRIQQYITEGTPLLGNDPDYQYEPGRLATLYVRRATSLDWSNRFLNNVSASQIEFAYQQAIDIAERYPEDIHSRYTLVRGKLYYVVFLEDRFGAERTVDIQKLLKDIISIGSQVPRFQSYTAGVLKRSDTNYIKIHILRLAQISNEFKDFLSQSTEVR